MTWSRITISARAAMPFSRPTSFERLARNFESFRKPRTGLPILFLCASLNRNEGRHEPETSNLMRLLDWRVPEAVRMPHAQKQLSTCDRDAVRTWIRQGAKNN